MIIAATTICIDLTSTYTTTAYFPPLSGAYGSGRRHGAAGQGHSRLLRCRALQSDQPGRAEGLSG